MGGQKREKERRKKEKKEKAEGCKRVLLLGTEVVDRNYKPACSY